MGIIPRQPGQPGAWPAHLAPAALGPQCRVGVLLHSTDPPGSLISDTQPESTHCHKHNEFLGESTEGCSGPRFPTRVIRGPLPPRCLPFLAALPLPVPSPAALGRGSQKLPGLCCLLRGLPHSQPPCGWRLAGGQCPAGARDPEWPWGESVWGSNFLPLGLVWAEVRSLPHTAGQTRPFAFSSS